MSLVEDADDALRLPDAAFIARARSLVPELAAALKAVRSLSAEWRDCAKLAGSLAPAAKAAFLACADSLDAALQGTPSQAAEQP